MSTVNVVQEQTWTLPLTTNHTHALEEIDNYELLWCSVCIISLCTFVYTFLKIKA